MTYNDAVKSFVSRKAAQLEIKRHGLEWSDFVSDCGDHETYTGLTILNWLGY